MMSLPSPTDRVHRAIYQSATKYGAGGAGGNWMDGPSAPAALPIPSEQPTPANERKGPLTENSPASD